MVAGTKVGETAREEGRRGPGTRPQGAATFQRADKEEDQGAQEETGQRNGRRPTEKGVLEAEGRGYFKTPAVSGIKS